MKHDSFYKVRCFVNDDPTLTIANIFINEKKIQKRSLFQKQYFFKQSHKKRLLIVLIKTIVFKNDRYPFSKSSMWVVFKIDRFFPKTKRSFLKTINNPSM